MKNFTHLFIDISNSWTKFCDGDLRKFGQRHSLETANLDAKFLAQLKKQYPQAMLVIASVVPVKGEIFRKHWPKNKLHFVSHKSPMNIKIRYPRPEKLGADRIANGVAVAEFYPCPCIVVDFGTAVTFDVISAKKEYLGGAIAPGLNAMADYLHERTALLPHMQLKEPKRIIGQSTVEAMEVGTVIGYCGLVKEIIRETKTALRSKKVTVVATGGHAELIAKHVPEIQHIRPLLTLEGIQIVARNL